MPDFRRASLRRGRRVARHPMRPAPVIDRKAARWWTATIAATHQANSGCCLRHSTRQGAGDFSRTRMPNSPYRPQCGPFVPACETQNQQPGRTTPRADPTPSAAPTLWWVLLPPTEPDHRHQTEPGDGEGVVACELGEHGLLCVAGGCSYPLNEPRVTNSSSVESPVSDVEANSTMSLLHDVVLFSSHLAGATAASLPSETRSL